MQPISGRCCSPRRLQVRLQQRLLGLPSHGGPQCPGWRTAAMPKEILCPICGAAYNLAEEQLGKKVRCRKCEHAFTAGGEQRRREDDDDEDDDRESRRRRSKVKKGRARDEEEYEERPKKTKSLEEQAKPAGQRDPGL